MLIVVYLSNHVSVESAPSQALQLRTPNAGDLEQPSQIGNEAIEYISFVRLSCTAILPRRKAYCAQVFRRSWSRAENDNTVQSRYKGLPDKGTRSIRVSALFGYAFPSGANSYRAIERYIKQRPYPLQLLRLCSLAVSSFFIS